MAEWDRQYAAGKKPDATKLRTQFKAIRAEEFPWTFDVSKSIIDYTFRNLSAAFSNFFRGVKTGEEVGYPRFKSKRNPVQSFTIDNGRFKLDGHDLKLQKCPGILNIAESLRFDGKIMRMTVSSYAGHWYASIAVEMGDIGQDPNGPAVGVDLGIKRLAVTSDGKCFENQKALRINLDKLAKLQRRQARKQRGSRRWHKLHLRIQRLQARIAAMRRDAIHKMTTDLCRTYGHIAIEDLNVKGLIKNRRLARAIADCGWHEIRRQLAYKGKLYGAVLAMIDRWFPSSKLHAKCGYINHKLTLADRVWLCPKCDEMVLRDENAAKNILAVSLGLA